MPYPLPDDVAAVSGLRWYLVAVPDDVTYGRVALGVYTSLAKYWQWGLEGPVPIDSDLAAQQWADAIDATLEALEMGFPDILLGYIDDVETLLQQLVSKADGATCCGSQTWNEITWAPIGGDTQIIISDTDANNDPSTFPVTPATDPDDDGIVTLDDLRDYLCGAAYIWVDTAIDILKVAKWALGLFWGFGDIATSIGRILIQRALPGILDDVIIWSLDEVAEWFDDGYRGIIASTIDDVISDMESERDAMAQAMACADNAAEWLLAWAAAISALGIPTAIANFLIGGLGSTFVGLVWNGFLDAEWSTACSCTESVDVYSATWDTSGEGWTPTNMTWVPSGGAVTGQGFWQGDEVDFNQPIISPVFRKIAATHVAIEWYAKANITTHRTDVFIYRASDDLLLAQHGIVSSSDTGWDIRGATRVLADAGEIDVYVKVTAHFSADVDQLKLTFHTP